MTILAKRGLALSSIRTIRGAAWQSNFAELAAFGGQSMAKPLQIVNRKKLKINERDPKKST
jgi:hypothetical protein